MSKVIRNGLWAAAIAWIAFLNGYGVLGVIVLGIFDVVMVKKSNVNVWRMASTFLGFVLASYYASAYSTIGNYFGGLFYFLISVSLNAAAIGEYLKSLSQDCLFKSSCITMAIMIGFFLVAIILPDSWYSIFTKGNLYLLIGLVFMPYNIPLVLNSFVVEFKSDISAIGNI